MEQIQTWKDALTKVANTSGWDLQDRYESSVIQKITETIFNRLHHRLSVTYKKLVGIDSHVQEMMNLLGVGLNDVRFIGIHGMGGVGKTTLSEVIYDRVSNHFEGRSFIASAREEIGNPGLVSLQKQLLSQILQETEIQISNVHQGIKMISNRLQNRMVFIVIDDVDREEQLEALAGT
ncbi:TMV resistance protein N [Morella rubra]|uniref:TMV resistance protein N n=1 Tax=Morella rubra TaxID=262757 RepID=A0A6A1WE54_9ROSI|nr:TMV resistance protein N [Morella rubra]